MRFTHAWFRGGDAIDDLERRALPEFFDGSSASKTRETYVQMRNLMVSAYREAPQLHLSVTECRRRIAADVGCVTRVHAFLEHWGIINSNEAAPAKSDKSITSAAGAPAAPLMPPPPTAELALRAPLAMGGGEWSPQQTFALIEALEALGADGSWDEIATQIGRSAEECVAHFLALPIDEPHAPTAGSHQDGPPPEGEEANGGVDGAAATASTTTDPMLSQLALLAHAVAPPPSSGGGAAAASDVSAAGGASAASAATAALRSAARACASSVLANAVSMRPPREDDAELVRLVANAAANQAKLVEAKLAGLEELSSLVQREKAHLERLRGNLRTHAAHVHHVASAAESAAASGAASSAAAAGGPPPSEGSHAAVGDDSMHD